MQRCERHQSRIDGVGAHLGQLRRRVVRCPQFRSRAHLLQVCGAEGDAFRQQVAGHQLADQRRVHLFAHHLLVAPRRSTWDLRWLRTRCCADPARLLVVVVVRGFAVATPPLRVRVRDALGLLVRVARTLQRVLAHDRLPWMWPLLPQDHFRASSWHGRQDAWCGRWLPYCADAGRPWGTNPLTT